MITGTVRYLGLLAAALALSACASMDDSEAMAESEPMAQEEPVAEAQMMQAARYDPFAPQEDLMLKFGWSNMGTTTASEAALQSALYEFGVRYPNGSDRRNLRSLINRIPLVSNRVNGLGGVQARGYLAAIMPALQGNGYGGPLDPLLGNPNQWAKVTGQIQDEVVNKDGMTEPGFYFDAADNSGYLWVLMVTETQRGATTKSIGQMFKVAVPAGGIVIEPKVETSDPNYDPTNVFPNFATASGIRVNATKATDYEFKLWANGEDIQVAEYWYNPNYDTGAWQKYYQGQAGMPPSVESIFLPDPMACLDMMFQEDPRLFAGGVLPPMLDAPPFYCLGRCKQPPIINTR